MTMSDPCPDDSNDRTGGIPDLAPDLRETLDRFAELTLAEYIHLARRWIRRCHIDERWLAPGGAVDNAWLVMLTRLQEGKIQPSYSLAELKKTLTRLLRNAIVDERRRQSALKRACAEGMTSLDTACDVVDPHATAPDEHTIGKRHAERLLGLLESEDPSLLEIVVLRMDGYSNEQIACKLGWSEATIERKFQRVRSILRPYLEEN